MNEVEIVNKHFLSKTAHDFRVGDTVEVSFKIKEGDKERVQVFKGVVIQQRGEHINKTFTVRKISEGVGVEKIYPLYSPNLAGVKVVKRGKVRRSKLFYLRKLKGKASKIKELSPTK